MIMKNYFYIWFITLFTVTVSGQEAEQIIQAVDKNISAKSQILESTMTVHGKRNSRTMTAKSYTIGAEKSFTEYLSPPREMGTKMLKLSKEMWVYSPSTDRIIMISGHMLRQSVMGSDLSYEDMMEDRKLMEMYTPSLSGEETIDGTICYVITLTAKVDNVAYYSQKMWVDMARFIPLKQELYAKSGQLLKQITLSGIKRIQDRWFPTKMVYKDMLKEGKGTEYTITNIEFDKVIPATIFSKASLKK